MSEVESLEKRTVVAMRKCGHYLHHTAGAGLECAILILQAVCRIDGNQQEIFLRKRKSCWGLRFFFTRTDGLTSECVAIRHFIATVA